MRGANPSLVIYDEIYGDRVEPSRDINPDHSPRGTCSYTSWHPAHSWHKRIGSIRGPDLLCPGVSKFRGIADVERYLNQ